MDAMQTDQNRNDLSLEVKGELEYKEKEDAANEDDIVEEEPALHWRTYTAFLGMVLLNFVQVYALTGPPQIVSESALPAFWLNRHLQLAYIGTNLNGTAAQNWVPNSLSLVQAVLGPALVHYCAFILLIAAVTNVRLAVIRFGHISGPQNSSGISLHCLFHRCSYCPRVYNYLSPYWRAGYDRFWVCRRPACRCYSLRSKAFSAVW